MIVNWNSRDDLSACLSSLEAQEDAPEEVIVVDNGSTDGSSDMVKERFPSVRLIRCPDNLGFAEGCNVGLGEAVGEWILTLNNDAEASPELIQRLRAAARDAGATTGMLQARMVFSDSPDRLNSTGILLQRNGRAMDRSYGVKVEEDAADSEVFCPTAGAALYRRAALDDARTSAGIFDAGFFLYMEDVDLGWRCRLAGWGARYVPEALVMHQHAASTKRIPRRSIRTYFMVNRLCMLLKDASTVFIARSAPWTLFDLARLFSWHGPRGIPKGLARVQDALRQRKEIASRQRVTKHGIEQRWATGGRVKIPLI